MKSTIAIFVMLMICSPAGAAKLWMTGLPTFINQHPGEHWIVGQTTEPALSAEEAESMAQTDAAGKIADILNCGDSESRTLIVTSLLRSDWIVDRQIDSTQHPYGTIWHAAILIDATPGKLDDLSKQIQFAQRHQHLHTAFLAAVSIAWLTAVGAFYLLINWMTRGYFRARLVMASLLLIVVGILGAVHLL
jgi:hypothetical protein